MEFLILNREKLDDAINYLNDNLSIKILIVQKIKLISMFHDLLDNYKNESIVVSSSNDEITIRIDGVNTLAAISSNIDRTIRMYSGKISIDGNRIVIILSTNIKKS